MIRRGASAPQQLAEHALRTTTSPECVVIIEDSTSANLRWANSTLTTNGVSHTVHVTVISFRDGAAASIGSAATTKEQVTDLVAAADRAVREATQAEDRQPLVSGEADSQWDLAPGSTSIEVYRDVAADLGTAFDEATTRDHVLYGFVDHDVTTTYLASSTGLRLRHEQPTGHIACTAKTADLTASAWTGTATRDFADVDVDGVAAQLARRLAWSRIRVDLPAGRYDTVLPPSAVADLMIDAYWSAGARVAHEGQSVYSRPGGGTLIGDQLVRPGVRLHSDPGAAGLECAPFAMAAASSNETSVFDNGLPLRPTDWISDGRMMSLLQTRHSAGMTGQPVTPAIDNLMLGVDGGTGATEDLVGGMERGLLLTCLWYIREVDPQTLLLTGLTRDGVYLVEDGEISAAVNNFRFNESPIDLLRRFSQASATVPSFSREWGDEYFSRTATPALRIPDFNMSSVSRAQ